MSAAGQSFSVELPPHLEAVQLLVNRCPTLEDKKGLIVAAGTHEAITADEATLLISANQLETA